MAHWEALYSKALWKTLKKEKDKLVGSSAGQNTLKKPLSCHCPDHCRWKPVSFIEDRCQMPCPTCRSCLYWTRFNFCYCLSLLSTSTSIITSKGLWATVPRGAEISPKHTTHMGGCHSADTALIHPSTSPSVRLLGAHKTWEKARCSSPRAVSLELLPARDLGWAHTELGLLLGLPNFCLQYRHKGLSTAHEISMKPSFLTWITQVQEPELRRTHGGEKTTRHSIYFGTGLTYFQLQF